MSQELINHSPDLKKLQKEGYSIGIKDGFLFVRDVPYVNSKKKICTGILVSSLAVSGKKTQKPNDHVCHFAGEYPCHSDGNYIEAIRHSSGKNIFAGVEVMHSFSNKPRDGYSDYYDKMTTYCTIIENEAQAINPGVSARVTQIKPKGHEGSDDSIFNYQGLKSSQNDISAITDKISMLKVAVIGLGGTGSYLLDFLSKTNVKEIHIFDNDKIENHNAFRMPGALSLATLNGNVSKVAHLKRTYSKMRKGIFAHRSRLTNRNFSKLNKLQLDFVFICIDDGATKKEIVTKLIATGLQFIDAGIGVQKREKGVLAAIARTSYVAKGGDCSRIPMNPKEENEYDNPNIQIAEVNAINAILAIIKWKKIFKIYEDCSRELNSFYDLSYNRIINE